MMTTTMTWALLQAKLIPLPPSAKIPLSNKVGKQRLGSKTWNTKATKSEQSPSKTKKKMVPFMGTS
eukprot:3016790-Ditylum_brightwellii.AAC.1